MDISAAQALPGVVKVLTCFDVPDIQYPTPGHPWIGGKGPPGRVRPQAAQPPCAHLRRRHCRRGGGGQCITARRGPELIRVEYEEYPVVLEPEQAMAEGAPVLHEENPDNILARIGFARPCRSRTIHEPWRTCWTCPAYYQFRGTTDTQQVQHCHIEPPSPTPGWRGGASWWSPPPRSPTSSGGSSARPWASAGATSGSSNPTSAAASATSRTCSTSPSTPGCTTQVGGRCVRLDVSREETFQHTRVRHPISFHRRRRRCDGDSA